MERGDLTGTILDGRYRVLEPVAEGAMGVVYRAERVKLGRIVAIKVLHDVLPNELSGRKRFEIEAMAMAKLEHPHCASVLDVGIHGDRPYVVMDFVSGQNLKEVIATGPQPILRATEIVRQVLSGLAHAHEHGIIHRDIKPANLVLSQKTGLGDHVKILDFGLARLHDTGQNLTTGLVVGTPAYMAPEQIRGQKLDHRADLYACGVLLFELLTGHKPFHSEKDDPIEVCKMHLSDPIPRLDAKLAGVEFGELEAVAAKALAKHRDDRYASAQDYAAALDVAVPRRPSYQAIPPASTGPVSSPGGSIQLASADVMEVGDVSYPPSLEVRSADVMSAIPAEPSHVGTGVDVRARTATPPAGLGARVRTATPPVGVIGAPPEPPAEIESAPGTFLGLALTPPPAVAPRASSFSASPETASLETASLETASLETASLETASLETASLETASLEIAAASAAAASAAAASATASSATAAAATASSATAAAPASPPVSAPASARASHKPPARRRPLIALVGLAAAAGVVALVVMATRGGTPAPEQAGVASGSANDRAGSALQPDPAREIVVRVNALLAQGDKEVALELLDRSRRQYPTNAGLAYAEGRIYFSKYYWTDGLKSFRDAIRNEPTYRADPELIKTVLRGFIMTPSYNDELASFLREDIGSAAQPFLEETARDHPNAAIRSRAASELQRYR